MRKLAGVQRNLFFVIVSLFALAGCGGSGSPAHSSAAASPQGVDPSIGTGADAGQPDAGPTADAPDAGPAVDCSANAPFDARCFDPGTPSVAVTQSDAAQCAPFLPIAVPKPVLFTKTFLGPAIGTGNCGAVADGDGHLGVCMYSDPGFPADGTRTEVMGADGTILATLPGGVRLSGPHGFLTEHTPVDYGQLDTVSAWSGGVARSLLLGAIPYPLQPDPPFCSWAAAPDSTVTAACWSSQDGASLRHFGAALDEIAPPVLLAQKIRVAAIDEQGRLLASEATDTVRWRNPDGSIFSDPIAGTIVGRFRPLVGGGYDTSTGVLPSGSTEFVARPQWLAERADGDLTLVRGRRAYGYVPPGSSGECAQRLEVLAPDGTVCATVAFDEPQCVPGTPASGPMLQVGAEGSVAERAGWYCHDGTCLVAFRVWNHLLQ
ncbi:MAG: hypothetical protein ACJ79U_04485 [Myxococcales bacterium]